MHKSHCEACKLLCEGQSPTGLRNMKECSDSLLPRSDRLSITGQ